VAASTGVNFYQDKPFLTSKEIYRLSLKDYSLNLYLGLFLNSLLSFNGKYYNRYYRRNKKRLKEERIILPAKEIEGKKRPDWEFMEDYIYENIRKLLEKFQVRVFSDKTSLKDN